MAGPLDISLKDELLFIKSLLIPAFDPDNELETSKKRKKWLETRGVEKKWSLEILTELIERYGTIVSLEEAKAEKVQAERLLEKAEEKKRKHGKNHLFTLIVLRPFLSIIIMLIIMCRLSSFVFQVVLVDLEDIMIVLAKLLDPRSRKVFSRCISLSFSL
jgi:hypothetical protein